MIQKPRIYVAITTFLPSIGGAETQTLAQCQRLLKAGHDVRVLTFRHQHFWEAEESVKGVPVKRVAGLFLGRREKLPRLARQFLYLLAMLAMSWTIWRHRKDFDVLQVCQFSALVLPLAIVCRFAHKPMTVVVISAGADKATKTRKAVRLLAGPLDPSTPWLRVDGKTWIDGDLYGLKRAGALVVNCTRTLLEQVGAVVIVLSSRMLRYLQENDFDLPGAQLVPNGVDIVRFQPASDEEGEARAQTVVCVSNARYEKGLDVLLQAWRLVYRQQPEAKLVILGDGPMQEQLEKMADALKISQSVEFAGVRNDVPEQLHRGLVSVLPSRWEGMPNALLEAMASGLACVATRVSGSEDVIQHGVNGLLVDVENYEEMAQALITLLRDPALVRRYGAEARITIEQGYTLDHALKRYTSIYRRLTSSEEHSDDEPMLQEQEIELDNWLPGSTNELDKSSLF